MTTTDRRRAFVVLAAGRGTRIGRVGSALHKALVPLQGRAVLSHLFELAPSDAELVVCVGHRAQQLRDYVELAHPKLDVTFVDVPGWDQVGGGPGASLLAARDVIGGHELYFTSCDTLWNVDIDLWDDERSWVAAAPMPVGTRPERWCRLRIERDVGERERVHEILDKTFLHGSELSTYVGLAHVARRDLARFWSGIEHDDLVHNERQVSGGLRRLVPGLGVHHVHWTDVGDAEAYHRAVIQWDGYDWAKESEATWVLPLSDRVVKFWADDRTRVRRWRRGLQLGDAVPAPVETRPHMFAYRYVPGRSAYDRVTTTRQLVDLLDWAQRTIWQPRDVDEAVQTAACRKFYSEKTFTRIARLRSELLPLAYNALARVDWSIVTSGVEPVLWHGDLNFGNIIVTQRGEFVGIDWRGDFGGRCDWGDKRYDVAKLLIGCRINWDAVRRGTIAPWRHGREFERVIREVLKPGTDVDTIAALALLSGASLHEPPLDEVLVVLALRWLEDVT